MLCSDRWSVVRPQAESQPFPCASPSPVILLPLLIIPCLKVLLGEAGNARHTEGKPDTSRGASVGGAVPAARESAVSGPGRRILLGMTATGEHFPRHQKKIKSAGYQPPLRRCSWR